MDDEGAPDLAGKVRRGLAWSLLNTVLGRAGTLLVGIALARLLAPADFGVFAVALVALAGVLAINELGVSLALVRLPGDPRVIAPTVTTISIATSVLLYAACFLAAAPFAAALHAPAATGVVRLLCLAVIIDGVTAAPAQLINREFAQGRRAAVDLTNLVLSSGLTIVLAVAGFGAWSLAIGRLVGNGFTAGMLCRFAAYWPRPGFDRRHARALLGFGLPLAAASLLVITMLNVDNVIVGRLLGPVALGLYVQAFNLSSWPVNVFSTVVRRVSLAAFSRVQDDAGARTSALVRSAALLAAAALPVSALLGLLASPLVTTLYGSRWAPAAAALQFLAVVGAARVLIELAYDFLVACGRARVTMALQGGWLVGLVPALLIGAHVGGIAGAAAGHAIVSGVLVLPAFAVAVVRTGVPARALLGALVRPVAGTLLLAGAVLAVRAVTTPSWTQLILGGALGLAVYLPVVAPLRHLARTAAPATPQVTVSPT
ncbi:MAG: oligosaccharide flippase family protein [Actinobacteria bacterium]|nr:oligosaccharide flippase family protein [Actinomycetota bacterium]MBI3686596.1 oligosaccharide flippase family protein [Actinomycetota bacterium]